MIGETVGRFRIVAKLGEGGMGSVWKAEDPLLGRAVAIKFLPESLARDEESRRRFLREARAASALEHPGIATIYDAGETDGRLYIAMQLIDGETVSDCVRAAFANGGALPLAVAVRIVTRAAEALGYAHERGVVHRDITGRNIMIARDGRVFVVDFGLALPEGHTRITRTADSTRGTVGYLAPEVIQGEPADSRSDLYSLAVVLFELITGHVPFEAARNETVLSMAVNESPHPPSAWRSGVPWPLDVLILKALAKNANERHQTASDLTRELGRIATQLGETAPIAVDAPAQEGSWRGASSTIATPRVRDHRASPTRPASSVQRRGFEITRSTRVILRSIAGRLSTPTRRRVFVLVLGLALLGAAGFWVRSRVVQSSHLGSVAVLPLDNVSEDAAESDYLCSGIMESITARLNQISGLRVTPWVTSSRYSGVERPLEEIAEELSVEALIVGTFRRTGSRIHGSVALVDAHSGFQYWAQEFEEPLTDLFDVQKRIAVGAATSLRGRLSGPEQQELSRPAARSVAAYDFYLRGAAELQGATEETNSNALALFEKALEIDSNLAEAYVGLGAVYADRVYRGWGDMQDLATAETNFERALELKPDFANARRGLVRIALERLDSRLAYEQARIMRESGRDDVDALLVRAEACVLCGPSGQAIPLLRRILEIDSANSAARFFLVIAYAFSGRHEETLQAGRDYVDRFGDDPELSGWMSLAAHCLGRMEDAERYYLLARSLRGKDNLHLATFFRESGQPERFDQVLRDTMREAKARLVAAPDNVRLRSDLAMCWRYLGELDSVRAEESRLGISDGLPLPGVDVMGFFLGHLDLGDTAGARQILERCPPFGGGPNHVRTFACWMLPKVETLAVYQDYVTAAARAEAAAPVEEW